jgi:DNA repair exonuclease SbcCD ATPase subunit
VQRDLAGQTEGELVKVENEIAELQEEIAPLDSQIENEVRPKENGKVELKPALSEMNHIKMKKLIRGVRERQGRIEVEEGEIEGRLKQVTAEIAEIGHDVEAAKQG